jgi:hypothetical protein
VNEDSNVESQPSTAGNKRLVEDRSRDVKLVPFEEACEYLRQASQRARLQRCARIDQADRMRLVRVILVAAKTVTVWAVSAIGLTSSLNSHPCKAGNGAGTPGTNSDGSGRRERGEATFRAATPSVSQNSEYVHWVRPRSPTHSVQLPSLPSCALVTFTAVL